MDLSNFSGLLTPVQTDRLAAAGVKFAIIQAIAKYAGGLLICRQQIQQVRASGILPVAYLWDWLDLAPDDLRRRIDLVADLDVAGFQNDVEDVTSVKRGQELRDDVLGGLAVTAEYDPNVLCYSAGWWFDTYAPGWTGIADAGYGVWAAQYDGIVDPAVFKPFNGWTVAAAKQFTAVSGPYLGVPSVDRDVLAEPLARRWGIFA